VQYTDGAWNQVTHASWVKVAICITIRDKPFNCMSRELHKEMT
jgi:hypothetical protein